jgi:hypothetical protein
MNNAQVIVLGMHRSGTSAVMKVLENMGCYIGEPDDFLPSNEGNPKGYWERWDVVSINKRLLQSQQRDWVTISEFALNDVPPALAEELTREFKQIVDRLNVHPFWAIKDPRLSLLMPLWQPLLQRPLYVLCIRDPIEVAKSLQTRNQLPLSVGLALWELYAVAMLRVTTGSPRIILDYHKLLSDSVYQTKRLCRWFKACGVSDVRDMSQDDLRSAIDPSLHRQRGLPSDADIVAGPVARLFELLQRESIADNEAPDVSVCARDILAIYSQSRFLSLQLKTEVSRYKENINLKSARIAELERARKLLTIAAEGQQKDLAQLMHDLGQLRTALDRFLGPTRAGRRRLVAALDKMRNVASRQSLRRSAQTHADRTDSEAAG